MPITLVGLTRPLLVCSLVALGANFIKESGRVTAQGSHRYFVPDAQSPNRGITSRAPGHHSGTAPIGMEGWGTSVIDIQSRSDSPFDFNYSLRAFDGAPIEGAGSVPLRRARIDLGPTSEFEPGFYHGTVTTNAESGLVIRTHWSAGGATAYEAPEPSRDLVIPLLMHAVSPIGTELYIMNNVQEGLLPEGIRLEFSVHDNETGEEVLEFFQRLRSGESGHEDTAFNPRFDQLPQRPGGGYIGALWLHAEEQIATIQYIEDADSSATAALRAVAVSRGATSQLLPLARAGNGTGSLLAIASVADGPASVSIRYLQAETGQAIASQTTSLASHGSVYIDLGNGGLGTMPRAAALGNDFNGSIVIEASAPVLASLYDRSGAGDGATGAAYNAFGPTDTGDSVIVTGLAARGKRSELMIQNGADRDVDVHVTFRDADGQSVGTADGTVVRGARLTVVPTIPGNLEKVSAHIVATGDVAVLARDWNVGDGPDCAVSAGLVLADGAVPTTPSRTATATATAGTATGTPTATSRTPTSTSETPVVTATPSPIVSSVPMDFHVYLPKAFGKRPGDQ